MINVFQKKNFFLFFFALCLVSIWLFLPYRIFAKEVVLSTDAVSVEAEKIIQIKVSINTDAEKVNAIGFVIDFSTEILEGLTPNQSGSSFPMCATLSSTKYECGVSGQNGFSGGGLVTTLTFRGRTAGATTITLRNFNAHMTREINGSPVVETISGFEPNPIEITVLGSGTKQQRDNAGPLIQDSSNQLPAPSALPAGQTAESPQPTEPGQSLGSRIQVPGKIGAGPEEILKQAATETQQSLVKGLFSSNNKTYLSLFPTLLLLALASFLGTRLHFSEKKRHIEIERLFDKQLGMLSSLESKIDLVEQKGGGGKEKFLSEFEEAKEEIINIEKVGGKHEDKAEDKVEDKA